MFWYVFVERYGDHRDLHVLTHSFPTRRSADLRGPRVSRRRSHGCSGSANEEEAVMFGVLLMLLCVAAAIYMLVKMYKAFVWHSQGVGERNAHAERSEEHTSELQSLMRISYAVFCLKKKKPHI